MTNPVDPPRQTCGCRPMYHERGCALTCPTCRHTGGKHAADCERASTTWPCAFGHANKTAGCTDCVEISGRTTGHSPSWVCPDCGFTADSESDGWHDCPPPTSGREATWWKHPAQAWQTFYGLMRYRRCSPLTAWRMARNTSYRRLVR